MAREGSRRISRYSLPLPLRRAALAWVSIAASGAPWGLAWEASGFGALIAAGAEEGAAAEAFSAAFPVTARKAAERKRNLRWWERSGESAETIIKHSSPVF